MTILDEKMCVIMLGNTPVAVCEGATAEKALKFYQDTYGTISPQDQSKGQLEWHIKKVPLLQ